MYDILHISNCIYVYINMNMLVHTIFGCTLRESGWIGRRPRGRRSAPWRASPAVFLFLFFCLSVYVFFSSFFSERFSKVHIRVLQYFCLLLCLFLYYLCCLALDSLYARIHGHQWNKTTGPHRVDNKWAKSPGRRLECFNKRNQKLDMKNLLGWPETRLAQYFQLLLNSLICNAGSKSDKRPCVTHACMLILGVFCVCTPWDTSASRTYYKTPVTRMAWKFNYSI